MASIVSAHERGDAGRTHPRRAWQVRSGAEEAEKSRRVAQRSGVERALVEVRVHELVEVVRRRDALHPVVRCEVIGALKDPRAEVKVRQVVAVAQRLGQTQLVELLLEQVPVCNAETSAAVKGADLAPLYGAARRSSCARARPERAQRAGPASGPSLGVALSESWRPKRRAGGARTAGGSSRRGGNEKLEEIADAKKSKNRGREVRDSIGDQEPKD